MTNRPPIDRDAGLAMSGNDAELYRRVLLAFYASHARDSSVLRRAIADNDPAAAQGIAHSLKGVIGMLGADDGLQSTADRVLLACAVPPETGANAWKPAAEMLLRELGPLLTAVEQVIHDLSGRSASNYTEPRSGCDTSEGSES